MNACIISSFLAAAVSGLVLGAETAYTTPVGYVSLGDTTFGQPAIKASTDVAVSIPLQRPTEYAGVVASTADSTITLAGALAWTVNQWAPGTSTPYLVTVKSGMENGYIGLITSNTANGLTVTGVTAGSLANIVAGDTVVIHKAWTLISLFPSGSFSAGVRVFGYSGSTAGVNLGADLNYLWTGAKWQKGSAEANDTILYSGESFVIRTTATPVATLMVSGEVPLAKSRTYVDKIAVGVAQDTRLSYYSPVDETIGSSGLSAVLTAGDRLLGFDNNAPGINKGAVENVLWNGNNWVIGATNVNTTYILKAGKSYIVRRTQNATVGAADWNDEQAYKSSL